LDRTGVQYGWAPGAFGLHHLRVSIFFASPPPSALNHIMKLVTVDEKMVIAEFYPAHYLVKRQKAGLEVQPAEMDILDYIILTFVFAENKRREREGILASSSHDVRECWGRGDARGTIFDLLDPVNWLKVMQPKDAVRIQGTTLVAVFLSSYSSSGVGWVTVTVT